MKNYYFLILLVFVFEPCLLAQPDTIIAENIYRYKVMNGKRKPDKQLIEQKTYDLQGKLIRQIVFKDSLMNVKKYTAFIYDKDQLISSETFLGDDSILEIWRFSYSSNGKVSEEKIYKNTGEKISLAERIKYYYKDTVLVKKEKLNRKNKWQEKTSYTYNNNEKIENTNYKKKFREDKLKSSQVTCYIKEGNIVSQQTNNIYYTGETDQFRVENEYDKLTGKVLRKIWKNNTDSILKIMEYRYKPDGTRTGECVVDIEGMYLEFIGFERKKHDVIRREVLMYDLKNTD